MPDGRILIERQGPLATLTLNDPKHMNAIDEAMRVDLLVAMKDLLADDAVRAILVTGEGNAFCAGANLRAYADDLSRGVTPDVGRQLRDGLIDMLFSMTTAPKPIVAAVNGAAAGFGCSLALAADIVLVGRSGYFVQSFVRLGAVPDGGSSWFLPRLAGRGRATAMMMLGEKIGAEQAVDWGLAHRVVNDKDLAIAARQLASSFAEGPTLAYGHIKRMIAASSANSFADQLELETACQEAAFSTADCREGIFAFREGRRAKFNGA